MQRRLLLAQRGQQIVLIEFADHLSFVNEIAHIDRQLLNNAARLALDFDLRYGLNFAGGDHRPRKIDALHLREFFRIDLDGLGPDGFRRENTPADQEE